MSTFGDSESSSRWVLTVGEDNSKILFSVPSPNILESLETFFKDSSPFGLFLRSIILDLLVFLTVLNFEALAPKFL